MNRKFKTAIVLFFLFNSISIWVFWTKYIFDFEEQNVLFSQYLTSFMVTHISSEYLIGVVTMIACILLFRKSKTFNIIWYFALGMHFYAGLQATGWAFSNGLYFVFSFMSFNIVLILIYLIVSVRSQMKGQLV
jgi:hypothetical protein